MTKNLSQERGFSLMEMIIAIIIMAVLSMGTLLFTKPIIQLWGNQNFHQGPAMEARFGLVRMVREMDQLRNITSVLTANSTTYKFVDGNNNTITYAYANGTLTRSVGTGSPTARNFITGLSAFAFSYQDKNNAVLATPTVGSGITTNIRTIVISLTVTVASRTLQVSVTAHPRNVLE